MNWDYRVVPAPVKGRRARGVKTPEAQFALAVEEVINEMAAAGWEYCRAEMLPQEERRGRQTYRNLLVFRREAGTAPAGRAEPVLESGAPKRPLLGRVVDGVMARPSGRREPRVETPEPRSPAVKAPEVRPAAAPAPVPGIAMPKPDDTES